MPPVSALKIPHLENDIANRLKNDYILCPDMRQRSIAGCYQNNVAWLYPLKVFLKMPFTQIILQSLQHCFIIFYLLFPARQDPAVAIHPAMRSLYNPAVSLKIRIFDGF